MLEAHIDTLGAHIDTLEAHIDTLGAMVAQITENGRLKLSPLGGLNPNNAEAENCHVITRNNGKYQGTFQMENASIHVNGKYSDIKREYDKFVLREGFISIFRKESERERWKIDELCKHKGS